MIWHVAALIAMRYGVLAWKSLNAGLLDAACTRICEDRSQVRPSSGFSAWGCREAVESLRAINIFWLIGKDITERMHPMPLLMEQVFLLDYIFHHQN